MNHSSFSPFSTLSDVGSSGHVISSLTALPRLSWRHRDPDASFGHAPAHHPRSLLLGYRVHTLICRGSGLPLFFLLSPANRHDALFAQPLLAWAVRLYRIRPRVIRLDAAYWGLRLIAWIHAVLGALAVIRLLSQASEESLLFTSYLDQRRTRETQQH